MLFIGARGQRHPCQGEGYTLVRDETRPPPLFESFILDDIPQEFGRQDSPTKVNPANTRPSSPLGGEWLRGEGSCRDHDI